MSTRRPARGRPAPRRPAYADYGDEYDDYDDRYDDRRSGSGALPWVLVSIFVLGAFALLIMVASGDDGDEEEQTSALPKVYDLSYKPFEQEYSFLLRHETETKGPTDFDKWMGESRGTMHVSYAGGTGSVRTNVEEYLRFTPGGPAKGEDRPPTESALSGRSFAFTLGPKGQVKLTNPTPETSLMRATLCYMFPDLPSSPVDYKRKDRFTWGNANEMVSKIKHLDGAVLDIRKYDMDVIPGPPGNLVNWGGGVTQLRWASGSGSFAGDATGINHRGKTQKGIFSGTPTVKLIMDYQTGKPLQVTGEQVEWVKICLHTEDEWIYTDKYLFQINPIKR